MTRRPTCSNARLTLLSLSLATLMLSACGDDNGSFTLQETNPSQNANQNTQTNYATTTLTLAHINDHHSHLEPDGSQEFVLDNVTYRSERGGFARLKSVFDDLQNTYGKQNFIKLHAGDAITGTSYYSFYKGNADADMMNSICFDAYALGNHEFDDGDAHLKSYLNYLHQGSCQTPVLAANVKPASGTPLAGSDIIKPYTIKTTDQGVKVAIVGIDITGKTKNSSRPLASTKFTDEVATAQAIIDELKQQGIEHIVLLTHYTYDNDIALASKLTGVDAIIGGDSHTLLGDFGKYGDGNATTFGSQGAYPTVVKNKDGDTVCIGQAWEYTKAVGLMQITFNNKGQVDSCHGSAIIPVGKSFEKYNDTLAKPAFEPLSAADNANVLNRLLQDKAQLLKQDIILPIAANTQAESILAKYKDQLSANMAKPIGIASQDLCLSRVPGTTRSEDIAGCADHKLMARGSDAAQVVAKAFLDASLRADFALQNAGGVRTAITAGTITNQTAYDLLPFSNTLVNLNITGKQVKDTLEDAIDNHMAKGGSTGSHPYADGLRWDLDMTKAYGNRISNLEVRDRATGNWSPIDPAKTYVMVTNDFIASGRDGYLLWGTDYLCIEV